MISSKVKISEFLSVCSFLMREAGVIISQTRASNNLKEEWKGKDDPMTIADVKSQTLIEKGLRKFWPNLSIVGEEEVEYEGDLNFDFSSINKEFIPSEIFIQNENKQMINNEFDLDESIVWIDPLDGTLNYVKNELDAVTTLIGVSSKNRPLMGLVCQHYIVQNNGEYIFKPQIFFGHVDFKKIYYFYGNELENCGSKIPWELKVNRTNIEKSSKVKSEPLIFCTSKNRFNELMVERIGKLGGKVKHIGGSGHKIMEVIKGNVDGYFYDKAGTKRWDTCAPEALLMSGGGVLTDMKGDYYLYNNEEVGNLRGNFAMMDRVKHKDLLEVTKNFEINK